MRKNINYKYIFIALLSLAGVQSASANDIALNTTPIQDATVKIEASHDALLDIKDNATITEAEKEEKGVTARREIIKDAISLSLAEMDNIRKGLVKLPDFNEGSLELGLKNKFFALLNAYAAYYEEKASHLNEITTVEEAKTFAKEIVDYRSKIYNPSIETMGEFLLIFYTEETISLTKNRLTKMLIDISKLEKLSTVKLSTVKLQLDKATELLASATEKHLKARSLVIRTEATPEPSLDQTPTATETTAETEVKIFEPTAKDLIEESLNNIKSTYDIFIRISKDVRKSLGLK